MPSIADIGRIFGGYRAFPVAARTPEECRRYFTNEYPAMVAIDSNLAMIKNCGYDLLGHFILPGSAWLENYYVPLEHRLQSFRKAYRIDPERMQIIDSIQLEISVYRRHSDCYGYVFYLIKNP